MGHWCNIWGVIHGIRTFVPIMLQQGTEGHVVNTASMAGHLSAPFMSVYDATKFAVVTMSESLYLELLMQSSPIKVSVLCPGFVKTNIIDSARNRPAHLATPERPVPESHQAFIEMARSDDQRRHAAIRSRQKSVPGHRERAILYFSAP